MLEAVGRQVRRGPRLGAFFRCMYYAGMRPGEVVRLRKDRCVLPAEGWGKLNLNGNSPRVGSSWTDNGMSHDPRGLKHRPEKATRPVPIPPELARPHRPVRHRPRRPPVPDLPERHGSGERVRICLGCRPGRGVQRGGAGRPARQAPVRRPARWHLAGWPPAYRSPDAPAVRATASPSCSASTRSASTATRTTPTGSSPSDSSGGPHPRWRRAAPEFGPRLVRNRWSGLGFRRIRVRQTAQNDHLA